MAEAKKTKKPGFEQADKLTLTELEQVRVLADPLRVRIIEQLIKEERTTKQVAESIGEKPTKLYHHVEALEKIGLIRQTRTRRNRGTLERYYLAVARQFNADDKLFTGEQTPPVTDTMMSLVSTILETAGREMKELVALGPAATDMAKEGVLGFLEIDADEKTIARVRRRLHRLLKDLQSAEGGDDDDEPKRQFRLLLAYYPVDHEDRMKG